MLSLLIVDDEVLIADSLYAMIQEAFQERLAVRRCYTAADAQAIMEKTPVNILMTDINMPNTSGLQLHRWVMSRWPMTRVIYLTGYSDFEYVREALDHHAQAYLLKSDGDDRIIAAIEDAMRSVDEESERLLVKAQAAQARPMVLGQLARRLVYGPAPDRAALQEDLARWNIGLDTCQPLIIGQARLRAGAMSCDAVIAVIEALALGFTRLLAAEISAGRILLLAQNGDPADIDEFSGLLEEAQRILETRGQQLTVALLDAPVRWDYLPEADGQLLKLFHEAGLGEGELRRFPWREGEISLGAPDDWREWGDALEGVRNMHDALMTGQRDSYFTEEARLTEMLKKRQSPRLANLIYSSTALNLQSASEGLDLGADAVRLERIKRDGIADDLTEARRELIELAERVFEAKGRRVDNRMRDMMKRVDAYIRDHMADDLSLTALADMVHFHPVYLSRVYKDTMGVSLSDTIVRVRMSAACAMLRDSRKTITEISRATGFSSANYFARWFRKHNGVSPQEYRDQNAGPIAMDP